MPLNDTAFNWISKRIPDNVTISRGELDTAYDETGLATQVALDIVEGQLRTILEAGPASFNVSGVYQEDYTAVVNGLQQTIKRITAERDSERATVAAGIDPWAPVSTDNPGVGALGNVTSGQTRRACSSWDR